MTKLEKLEMEIASLPQEEYRAFRRWFLEMDWKIWDRKIEEDSKAGKLDFLVKEANDARKKGKLEDL